MTHANEKTSGTRLLITRCFSLRPNPAATAPSCVKYLPEKIKLSGLDESFDDSGKKYPPVPDKCLLFTRNKG
jgi:hypothetical protein